jgi:hypothetical protein
MNVLLNNRSGRELRIFLYGVTEAGWLDMGSAFRRWLKRNENRRIVAYVGTDHAITDAEAIELMIADGVVVRLMTSYNGTFHPKVFWLGSDSNNMIWIGSNNLTLDGLRNNIEFAAVIKTRTVPRNLERWARAVHEGSEECTEELLESFRAERSDYGSKRAGVGTFTWSRREKPKTKGRKRRRLRSNRVPTAERGNLILEIMPRETGQDGKQIQLPMQALSFFGLKHRVGSTRLISLRSSSHANPRVLTMTVYKNHTARLVIRELDYRDRPCVLLFKKRNNGSFVFDIVSRSAFPPAYRDFLEKCPQSPAKRRWTVVV